MSVIVITHPDYNRFLPNALNSWQSANCETIVYENHNETLARACNQAISEAHGQYIVRLDADDWISEDAISILASTLDTHPEIDCVWCDYVKVTDGHEEYYPQPELEHAGGAMYRKEVWEALGGYTETLERQEAFDFWRRFKQYGFNAKHISIPLYYYRRHDQNMSNDIAGKERARMDILGIQDNL